MWVPAAAEMLDTRYYHCLDPDCDVYGKAPSEHLVCWSCGGTNLKMNVSVPGWTAWHRFDPTEAKDAVASCGRVPFEGEEVSLL